MGNEIKIIEGLSTVNLGNRKPAVGVGKIGGFLAIKVFSSLLVFNDPYHDGAQS